MKIIKLEDSQLKSKRFRVYLNNNKHYDFGLKTGQTYIDHRDRTKRDNYRKRHYNSSREQPYIIAKSNSITGSLQLLSIMGGIHKSPTEYQNIK